MMPNSRHPRLLKTVRLVVAVAGAAFIGGLAIREAAGQTARAALGYARPIGVHERVAQPVARTSTFRVPLRIGQAEFLRLDVRADGADVRVRILTASGRLLGGSGRLRGPVTESVVVAAAAPGVGMIEVRAAPTRSRPGQVEIILVERRPVEPLDSTRASAQRAYAAGWALLDAASANVEGARSQFARAQELWAEAKDGRMEARAWRALGETYDRDAAYANALAAAERWRSLAVTANDTTSELWATTEIARQQFQSGQEDSSRATLLDVLRRWQGIGDPRGESAARVLLGASYTSAGDQQQAGDQLEQALRLLQNEGDAEWYAVALKEFGNYHNTFGERQRAVDDFSLAVKLFDRLRDRRAEAAIRHDFGTLYNMLGEYELARGEFLRSLSLARQVKDVSLEAHALTNLGTNYADLNEPERAAQYLAQARPVFQRLGDKRTDAILLNNLASIQRDLGQLAESLTTVQAAHRAFSELGMARGEMISLTGMGYMLCQFRRFDEGRNRLRDAVRLARESTDRAQEALALSYIAECDADAGELDAAHAQIDAAHALVEGLRLELLRDDLRASFFASARPVLERKIDILMRLADREPQGPWKAAAFEVSEAARARSLLDDIPALRTSIGAKVPAALAARRDALMAQLRNATPEAGLSNDLLAEYYELRRRIRSEDPRYAELTDPPTLSLAEAQKSLRPGTVALEYLLGRTRGHLWAITNGQVVHAALPGRQDIERLVRRMLRSVRQREGDSDPARLGAADQRYWRDAAALSRILLGPVADLLNSGKVYVVPDGVLHLVPFAALPMPNRRVTGRPTPLVDVAEVTSIPSLSVFASVSPTLAPGKNRGVAVIADPVYDAGDPRLARLTTVKALPPDTTQAVTFRRLAGSSLEAVAIARAAEGRGAITSFDGFEAARPRLAGSSLQEFSIVHFATHGLLDSRRPERSGLVLSLYDRQGTPADGYLRLLDVYDMSLSADVVVLSGCETALGREMAGEGVVGLTRGFLLAGASHVVSSHWNIRDVGATPQLMAWFYDALLRQQMSPAAALRYAQRRMWSSGRWSAPYFWAAFALYGP